MADESTIDGGILLARSAGGLKKSNRYRAGTPVLVLLDPSDSETKKIRLEIKLSDRDSVKLWVVNRLHIYISEDGVNWNHYVGSFEGCLAERKIRTHKTWGKYRRHIPLKSMPSHYIHYTSIDPSKITAKDHKSYKIQTAPVHDVHNNIKRPYPEGLKWTEFNKGIFSKGIRILKIPSQKINYPCDAGVLLYWETVIFRDSQDARINTFREDKIAGILTNTKLEKSVKPVLKNKLGTLLARLWMHSKANFEVEVPRYLPENDEHCFLYGISHDVMQKTGSSEGGSTDSRIDLTKMNRPLSSAERPTNTKPGNATFESLSFETFLRGFFLEITDSLAPVVDKVPPEPGLFWERTKQTELIMFLLENSVTTKHYDEERLGKFLIEKVRSTLNAIYPASSVAMLSNAFQVGIASDRETCTMLALNSVAAQAKTFVTSAGIDYLKEGKGDDYLYSVKRVYFATGSDSFSDDMVPKHVYFQLKGWWKNLGDVNPNEIEELKDSEMIEVIGFSSRFTTETTQDDNERLRRDRAWKTAEALKLVLEDDDISTTVTDSPAAKNDGVTIYYRGAPLDKYPGETLFSQYDVSFVEDVIDTNKIEVADIKARSIADNSCEDRVCLIVFKRPRPKGEQITKHVIETNNALPIYQYKTIVLFKKSTERENELVLMYACPGRFDDA